MRIKVVDILALNILIFLGTGAGYEGELPDLTRMAAPASDNISKPDLAPKNFSSIQSRLRLQQGEYSKYQKDLEDFILVLEKIKDTIESGGSLQLFSARANILELHTNALRHKYANSKESYYESYRNIVEVNDYLKEISDYWRQMYKDANFKELTNTETAVDKEILNKQLGITLFKINTTIETLRENAGD